MVDPESGLAAPKWQIQVGIVQFARCDAQDFSVDLFWDVYSYIFHLMDYYGCENFNYARFRSQSLIPNAFKKYQAQEHQIQRQYRENIQAFESSSHS